MRRRSIPAFLGTALAVVSEDGGMAAAKKLVEKGLSTEDPVDVPERANWAPRRPGAMSTRRIIFSASTTSASVASIAWGCLAGSIGTRPLAP